ncbi:hypothetical protein [Gimesia chilikensis]|uniref:hypothetical protein n=1 Tax=Gimesia chilikensis TaxID=2605989 RepID=UPI00118B855C|nr:hypothetical protein [Gimesia chilikensis]QDT82776.1 hypothetical protein MalM14_04060 [Gimesia chilikensis]
MSTQQEIYDAVSFLLESAKDRNTSQGVLVYTKILELLDNSRNEKEVQEILGKLNRSLAGIEAHGWFTDEELKKSLVNQERRRLIRLAKHMGRLKVPGTVFRGS